MIHDQHIVVARCCGGHVWVIDDRGSTCPSCGMGWVRTSYTTRGELDRQVSSVRPDFQIGEFKPYSEDGFTGKRVRVETRRQRDALCDKHGLSYDRCKTVSAPNVTPAIDSIDFGDVKAALEDPSSLGENQLDLSGVPETVDLENG